MQNANGKERITERKENETKKRVIQERGMAEMRKRGGRRPIAEKGRGQEGKGRGKTRRGVVLRHRPKV